MCIRDSHQSSSIGHGPAHEAIGCNADDPSARNRIGSDVTAPRPLTPTGCPSGPTTCAATGSPNTVAGAGGGRLPGHGNAEGRRPIGFSPHGTSAWRSAGERPPCTIADSTDSWPTMLCTRARPRSIRSSGPPPHSPVSYTHLRAHETVLDLVCRLLLE